MVSRKNQSLCVGIFIAFLIFDSQITDAAPPKDGAAKVESSDSPYKAVFEFCNQRVTSGDRAFCVRVLKSSPVSATAKDNVSLLKIAVDLAVGNAKKTKEYFTVLSTDKATTPSLVPILKVCISAFDERLNQLSLISRDLLDDPPMAGYDAHQANEELSSCDNSVKLGKVADDSILSRHKIAIDYGRLIEEISKSI